MVEGTDQIRHRRSTAKKNILGERKGKEWDRWRRLENGEEEGKGEGKEHFLVQSLGKWGGEEGGNGTPEIDGSGTNALVGSDRFDRSEHEKGKKTNDQLVLV